MDGIPTTDDELDTPEQNVLPFGHEQAFHAVHTPALYGVPAEDLSENVVDYDAAREAYNNARIARNLSPLTPGLARKLNDPAVALRAAIERYQTRCRDVTESLLEPRGPHDEQEQLVLQREIAATSLPEPVEQYAIYIADLEASVFRLAQFTAEQIQGRLPGLLSEDCILNRIPDPELRSLAGEALTIVRCIRSSLPAWQGKKPHYIPRDRSRRMTLFRARYGRPLVSADTVDIKAELENDLIAG